MEKNFNFDDFDIKLDTEFIGRNFIYCEEVDSTNAYLKRAEPKQIPNGSLVFAEFQSEGKGRGNHSWLSPKRQNLTFSIFLKEKKLIPKNLILLNFSFSLAILSTFKNYYHLKPTVKWPNDVLINSKKISGILTESVFEGSKIKSVIIGIGINVNQTGFPSNFILQPTSLRSELGKIINRELLLAELLNSMEEMLYRTIDNSSVILNEWRENCDMIGKRITVTKNDEILDGIFTDIDDSGFLILNTHGRTATFHFGDVSIR